MRRLLTPISVVLCGMSVTACATTTSTAKFKGAEHEVAQTVANLQSDVTSGEQKKICANDLASTVVNRLGGRQKCEAALKTQLGQIDSTEAAVESVQVNGATATAKVKATYSGKKKLSTLSLQKESGKWKISTLQ
jgi:hypothetical protein